MANFGLRDLVLVNPYRPVWEEIRSAVGAEEVVKKAHATQSLTDAIGDATLVLGSTSGSRRNLDRELIPLDQLAKWVRQFRGSGSRVWGAAKLTSPPVARVPKAESRRSTKAPSGEDHKTAGRAALLFGSEKTGLSNRHMSYCHGLLRIPTLPACPSMNLGQAVAVCCYELACSGMVTKVEAAVHLHLSEAANMQSLEHIFARAERLLDDVGYLKPKSREAMLIKLRRLLIELGLTNSDTKILGGILAQIEWKLQEMNKRPLT
jgi:tRNA/rRNA methyltransferase